MVFFTCNHCGEAVKKPAVEKHSFKCNRAIFLTCMDCLKDFKGQEYDAHTKCITELERYSAKGFVPKPNQNKGAKKQEAWVEMVRSIQQSKKNISQNVNKILSTISQHDNIPRKKASFIRFLQNSFRYMKMNDIEAAWGLLEEEMKKTKEANNNPQNGTTPNVNGNTGKRKLEEAANDEVKELSENPSKKKKIEVAENGDSNEAVVDTEQKFNWSETIKDILLSKNNQLKLTKLKKKVFKKYKGFTGKTEISDKIERKFNKKLNKLGLMIREDTVQLIQ